MKELNENQTSAEIKKLSEKESYFLKREQKEKERKSKIRQKKLKRVLKLILIILLIGGGISSLVLFLATRPSPPESEIISKQGIHWHAEISIKILGQDQEIPADIGMGITERYIHTHAPDSVIHMEFPGIVRIDDLRLGRFFEIWGKKFNKDCIFDKCNGSEGKLKMLVNGKENFEFENYIMRDGDKIEIIFE